MKLITPLKLTYSNVIGPLNENFDSIEYQYSEVLDTVVRADVMAIILEFIINSMDYVEFSENIRDRIGDNVTSSFINALLMDLNMAVILKAFHNEVSRTRLDIDDGHDFISVDKFGPSVCILRQ